MSKEDGKEELHLQTVGVTVPAVVSFAYKNFVFNEKKWSATCKKCNKTFSEQRGVTSAFTK